MGREGGGTFRIIWLDRRKCWHDDIAVLGQFDAEVINFNTRRILPLTESYFKLDDGYFQHDFWIFVHASVIIA